MTKVQVKQVNRSGLKDYTTVDYYEVDVDGHLYLFSDEYGAFALVRADTFENACGIVNLGHYWHFREYTNPLDILHNPMIVVPIESDEYSIDWEDFQDLFDCVDTDNEHSDRAKVVLKSLDEDGQPLPQVQIEIIDGDTYLKYLVYNVLNGHNHSIKSWCNMVESTDKSISDCIDLYFTQFTDKIEEYLGYELDYRLTYVADTLRFIDSLDEGFFGIVTDQPLPDDVLILQSGDRYSLSIAWNEYKHGGIFEITTLDDLCKEW